MERRYVSTAAAPRPSRPVVRARRSAAPADADALRIGGALALLAVAASTALLAAQGARLRRELRPR